MKNIIFVDVDGTLVDYDGTLSDKTINTIRTLRKKGNLVILCSGRSDAEIYDYIRDIGFDGFIGANGAFVRLNGNILAHDTLSPLDVHNIVSWLKERKLEYYLECNSGLYASEGFMEAGDSVLSMYDRDKGESGTNMTIKSMFPYMIYNNNYDENDVNKISYILTKESDLLDARKDFKHLEVNTWGGASCEDIFGDFGLIGLDKARGIDVMMDYLNKTNPNETYKTIAIGDGLNDVSMLKKCDISIAMGNSQDTLKNVATLITKEVQEDGLYHAFSNLKLI